METCEKVTGRKVGIESTGRPGDPARLVASSQKIYEELGWKAEYSLEQIIESAWKWHCGNVKVIQSLPLKECCQREAELSICVNQSGLKSNLLNQ
jgi:dTDP-D-glucose 4,6-dehydratase